MSNLVFLSQKNNPVTTSRIVAETFEKLHKNVLQSIEKLDCSKEFNGLNFAPVEYKDAKGEFRKEYLMTRDGFTFLAMGFTGAKAAQFKEQYIAAFNTMEREQRTLQVPMTLKEALLLAVQQEEEKEALQLQIGELAPKAANYDEFMTSNTAISVGDCAKLISKRINRTIGAIRLMEVLREKGILMRNNNKNVPYQSFVTMGLFEVKISPIKDKKTGETRYYPTTLILPKGVDYIQKLLSMPNN